MMTRYGHASRIFVHAGDYVMPGQEIAEVGSTGRSTGPHLHFEVIVGGAQINPSPYLALFKRKPNAQG
jgi:murein DD-endopeptidase MepM/ murein hydrolase activator NlpD